MYIFLIVMLLLLSFFLYGGGKALFENNFNRKNNLAVKLALDRVRRRNMFLISDIDIFKNKVIALDRKNNKIILLEHRNNVTWEKCLSLEELAFCNINKQMDQLTARTQKVVLELCFGNNYDMLCFTFYDESKDNIHELPSRIRKATNWKSKIQDQSNRVKPGPKLEYVL